MKTATIPRLELLGNLLVSHLIDFVKSALKEEIAIIGLIRKLHFRGITFLNCT